MSAAGLKIRIEMEQEGEMFVMEISPSVWYGNTTVANELYYDVYQALPVEIRPEESLDMVLYQKKGEEEEKINRDFPEEDVWDSCDMEETVIELQHGDVFVVRVEKWMDEDPADQLEQDEEIPWE